MKLFVQIISQKTFKQHNLFIPLPPFARVLLFYKRHKRTPIQENDVTTLHYPMLSVIQDIVKHTLYLHFEILHLRSE